VCGVTAYVDWSLAHDRAGKQDHDLTTLCTHSSCNEILCNETLQHLCNYGKCYELTLSGVLIDQAIRIRTGQHCSIIHVVGA
jgi:hypothetical protein